MNDFIIGRPQDAEAAPYYFTYINHVAGDDAVGVLESQLEESLAFFSGISKEKSRYRYAPEKWSIRQVLNHITDTERRCANDTCRIILVYAVWTTVPVVAHWPLSCSRTAVLS
jgi:hypothetical protein